MTKENLEIKKARLALNSTLRQWPAAVNRIVGDGKSNRGVIMSASGSGPKDYSMESPKFSAFLEQEANIQKSFERSR